VLGGSGAAESGSHVFQEMNILVKRSLSGVICHPAQKTFMPPFISCRLHRKEHATRFQEALVYNQLINNTLSLLGGDVRQIDC
jgi:hypothetical protein